MELNVKRLDCEDLLNILSDRFTDGIPEHDYGEKNYLAYNQSLNLIEELQTIVKRYKIDENHIR